MNKKIQLHPAPSAYVGHHANLPRLGIIPIEVSELPLYKQWNFKIA